MGIKLYILCLCSQHEAVRKLSEAYIIRVLQYFDDDGKHQFPREYGDFKKVEFKKLKTYVLHHQVPTSFDKQIVVLCVIRTSQARSITLVYTARADDGRVIRAVSPSNSNSRTFHNEFSQPLKPFKLERSFAELCRPSPWENVTNGYV